MTDTTPTAPAIAPARGGARGIVAVWIIAAVVAVVIGVAAPSEWRGAWMPVGLAGCLVLAFVIQLFSGRVEGFVRRMAASVMGALLAMGIVGLAFSLASLFQG